MLLTQDQFDRLASQNQLKIALIGMSNIGKSHWTRQIVSKHGFSSYEVDQNIQKNLSLPTISDAAKWMGHPYEDGYLEKADQYLRLEEKLTLGGAQLEKNTVLDTTGSVAHLKNGTLNDLKINYLIVYIKAMQENVELLISRFEQSPKPLIWGGFYKQKPNLTPRQNLIACYPALLRSRETLYDQLSDITLSVSDLGTTDNTDFLTTLRERLPSG